jgi:hypothetical protein|tara:strand:+ start:3760 stop:4050 length:291 start_codon:yes stop_codon:yes gene_type:complete
MLFDKPLKSGEVVSVKLITGEELIARFEKDDAGDILTVSKAVVLAPGEKGIGMVPWIMSAEPNEVQLNKRTVITYSLTQKEIATKYLEMTSSIQLV